MMLPIAILCGGTGTRMSHITDNPKSLIEVDGKPFIFHQLELLNKNKFRKIVLCINHLGDMIRYVVGDRYKNLDIKYSLDPEGKPAGTAGVIKNALPNLGNFFFVMYGDSYLPIDYFRLQTFFMAYSYEYQNIGVLAINKNNNQFDKSNIEYRNGRILKYEKTKESKAMEYIDYGISAFDKNAFQRLGNGSHDLSEVYENLLKRNELIGYEIKSRFYEIGSPEGLKDFKEYICSQKNI